MSGKFSSELAEMLWNESLEEFYDAEIGDTDSYGKWSALFMFHRAILHTNSQGFVWVDTYEDRDKTHAAWTHVVADFQDWEER